MCVISGSADCWQSQRTAHQMNSNFRFIQIIGYKFQLLLSLHFCPSDCRLHTFFFSEFMFTSTSQTLVCWHRQVWVDSDSLLYMENVERKKMCGSEALQIIIIIIREFRFIFLYFFRRCFSPNRIAWRNLRICTMCVPHQIFVFRF